MTIKRPIFFFLIFTFVFGWLFQLGARIAFDAGLEGLFGLLILLTTAAPGAAGIIALRFRPSEADGTAWSAGIFAWRQPLITYLIAILIFSAPWVLSAEVAYRLTGLEWEPNWNVLMLTPFVLLAAFFEEIGWRRFLLDQLLKRWPPLYASLGVGLIWGIWHVVDYIRQPLGQYGLLFLMLILLLMAHSLIYTWLYLRNNRSIPLLTVAHAATNLTVQIISPTNFSNLDEILLVRLIGSLQFTLIAVLLCQTFKKIDNQH